MIKFFRHIRRSLLEQNKMGKYFKYAIGEIFLVMIGILLALQVSNWNEKRKIDNDIDLLFLALELELERNILEINGLINVGHRTDSISTLFIENKITRDMIRQNPYLAFGDYRTRSTFLEDERLDEVIEQEKQLSTEKKELLPNIKLIKRRIKAWRYWQNKTLELSMQRRKELVSKTPYFRRGDSLAFEKIITRAIEDKIYRNEVEQYIAYQLGENVWEANLIRTSSVILLWQLRSSKNKNLNIDTFLKNLGSRPLMEFPCGEVPKKEYETYFGRSVLIYNNHDIEAQISLRVKGGDQIESHMIPPKSFLDPKFYFEIDNNTYYEFKKDGQCVKIYDANREDYIIL